MVVIIVVSSNSNNSWNKIQYIGIVTIKSIISKAK